MTTETLSHRDSARPGRDVRQAIVSAAARLFAERGYNATSVREVVEAAQCKKPTLYYYFENKERLYLEVIDACCQTISEVVADALSAPGSAHSRLLRGLRAYLDTVRRDPTILRLLMTAERHPEIGQPIFDFDAVRQTHIETLRTILEAGVNDGELRADLDVEEAVLALFGIIDHRLVLHLHGRPIPDDLPERALDLFFRGVGS